MTARIQEVVVDCRDAAALGAFWGALLGVPWGQLFDGWSVVGADPVPICFQQVPEPKSSPKNRMHLDIEVADLAAAVAAAAAVGARQLGEPKLDQDGGYVVMADPEDNEFCFVLDPSGAWSQRLQAALAPTTS